ncbi:hypothetical protein BFW01_g11997 [Lasiodiplodia theobromae]|nr:hypothetical protein BFW01_g11997 [Lasiodiplodia theobromae]
MSAAKAQGKLVSPDTGGDERSDCAYDAAGDQRRTSALKQRIHNLERHTRDLQDIVASIGSATDKEAATAVARQLADEGFRRTAEVAQALRRDETPKDSDAGDYAMLEASPSSAGSVVDPNLPYWPIDATDEGLQLGQNEYDSTPMEHSLLGQRAWLSQEWSYGCHQG